MKINKRVRLLIDIIIIGILVFFDQLSKMWAIGTLKGKEPIILIDGVLQFYYLPNGNSGAAFGILEGHQILFLIIATVVVTVVLFALNQIPATKRFVLLRILLILIAAGGIGNMIDRVLLNSVVDFIYFYLINFPIFNVADCYVTVATIVLAIIILFVYKENDIKELEDSFKNVFKRDKNEGI